MDALDVTLPRGSSESSPSCSEAIRASDASVARNICILYYQYKSSGSLASYRPCPKI